MSSIGQRMISSVLSHGTVADFLKLGLKPELFKPAERQAYLFIENHVKKYNVIPEKDTFAEGCDYPLVDVGKESPKYFVDELRKRYLSDELVGLMVKSKSLIKEDLDPETALETMLDHLVALKFTSAGSHLVDFRDIKGMVIDTYKAKLESENGGGILTGWASFDEISQGMTGGDLVSVVGRPAAGKAQPLTSKVLTTTGFKPMGEIRVGDKVASVDGLPSEVVGVYPQGTKKVYRLHFEYGRTVEACGEHLWSVGYREWDSERVIDTDKLISMLKCKRYQDRLSVSLFTGEYGTHTDIGIDPWLLGFLLGDGCFRGSSVMYSTKDQFVVSKVDSLLPKQYKSMYRSGHDYAISFLGENWNGVNNPIKAWLTDVGLWGCKSECKFIPDGFLNWSREQRLALLQGLMDSDGTAGKNGDVSYATSSERMADQFVLLVESLGGKANKRIKRTTHLPSYIVGVMLQVPSEAFSLPRKKERCRDSASHAGKPYTQRLVLKSIEEKGSEPCQCIAVSHPSHLYVTDRFVVTHNTFLGLWLAHHAWWIQQQPVLFVSMEMMVPVVANRLTAMHSGLNLTHLNKATLSSKSFNKMRDDLVALQTHKSALYLMDGNLTATVDDVWSTASQLKPALIVIDGGYLLGHSNNRLDRFNRVAENTRLLKNQVATDLNTPVVCSWQFSRQAVKKKVEDTGLEDIGFSDEIGQLSSIVLGLFEQESVETLNRRRVDIMKGRGGEKGHFDIYWDFYRCHFGEYYAPTDAELSFL